MDIAAGAPYPPARPEAPEVSGRRIDWTPKDAGIGILLFVGVFLLLPLPIALPLAFVYGSEDRPFLIISIILSAPIYLAIAWIAARMTFMKYGGGWERLGVRRIDGRALAWAAIAFGAAFAVSIAYGIIIEVLHLDFLKQECSDQVPQDIRTDALLLAMSSFLAVIFAPACEELYFRGFLFPGFARAWGPAAGIVTSGIIFGSAHLLGNPTLYKSMIQFSAIGMVFAFSYWKSGNIFSTMLAHFTFNLIGVITIASTTC
jgi:membrane protease YdiL (CAAX protease family)